MVRDSFLTIRTNTVERELAAAVAERLERTESDTVRLLLREKARELGLVPSANDKRQLEQLAGVVT
jgi:antitoxin component of RelBE/YafQ-DinJ toxin-antitoxin module